MNDQILEALRRKVVNMSSLCKVCATVFDEVSIKEFLVYNVAALSKVVGKSLDCSQCQRKALIVNLFVTIRLNHFLRENNRNFVGMKGRRNRKVLKFSHD